MAGDVTARRGRGRPVGSRDRHGKCLRRVADGDGINAWARLLGEQLQRVLEEQDVAVSELAAAIGCWDSTIHYWLRGDSLPSTRRLKQIADALGVIVADLMPQA